MNNREKMSITRLISKDKYDDKDLKTLHYLSSLFNNDFKKIFKSYFINDDIFINDKLDINNNLSINLTIKNKEYLINMNFNNFKINNNEFTFKLKCDYINLNKSFKFTNKDNIHDIYRSEFNYISLIENQFKNDFTYISNSICIKLYENTHSHIELIKHVCMHISNYTEEKYGSFNTASFKFPPVHPEINYEHTIKNITIKGNDKNIEISTLNKEKKFNFNEMQDMKKFIDEI